MSGFLDFLTLIILIAVCVGLLRTFVQYEGSRKFFYVIMCIVVVVTGVLATADIITRYTAESYVYGSVDYNKKEATSLINYNMDFLTLSQIGDTNTHSITEELEGKEFDGKQYNYDIDINGFTGIYKELSKGEISAVFKISFTDTKGDTVSEVSLKIIFEFIEHKTRLTLSAIKNGDNLDYLSQYVINHGLKISVLKGDKL